MISAIDKIQTNTGKSWEALSRAKNQSDQTRAKIISLLRDKFEGTELTSDADIVVFGSLARGEYSAGSDVDWTLLIDGQAKPEHRRMAHDVASALKAGGFRSPGTTGTFGNFAFSHEIIHHIGGLRDSNENLTQRTLLLLESKKLRAESGKTSYDRVVSCVIERYLTDEFGLGV